MVQIRWTLPVRMALELGFVDEAMLERCVDGVGEARLQSSPSLGEHWLIEQGLLSADRYEQIKRLAEKVQLRCDVCGRPAKIVGYREHAVYNCRRCGGRLITASEYRRTESEHGTHPPSAPQSAARHTTGVPPKTRQSSSGTSYVTRTIGHYRILKVLGEGGMGYVFLAQDGEGKRVALKVLPLSRSQSETDVARFTREARLAIRLSHPHIARAFDAGVDGRLYYLAMEFVAGASILELLRASGGPLGVDVVLKWLDQLLDALAHAHSNGVIHRDIKPDNILVDTRGNAKLVDFGLARRIEHSSHALTEVGRLVGTPHFFAPELIDGAPASPTTDLYALGVAMYAALTGHVPFHSDDPVELMRLIVTSHCSAPIDLNGELPRDINDFILTLMHHDASSRFETASLARDALLRLQSWQLAAPGAGVEHSG